MPALSFCWSEERDVALERAAEIKEDGDACVKALEVETNEAKMEKDQAEHHRLEREREMRKIFEHLCERRDALLKEAEDLERPGWLNFFCLCGSGPHKKGMLHTLSAASLPYFSSGEAVADSQMADYSGKQHRGSGSVVWSRGKTDQR